MPSTLTVTPTVTAVSTLARKLRAVTWATAFGTIISALMSSSPTIRIEITTVAAVSTASSTLRPSTFIPLARAYSSSLLTANSRGDSPTATSSTTAESAPKTTRSCVVVVVMAPNRYADRFAGVPSGDSPISTTPPAMPP